jgi:hypothetical protein
MPQASVTYLVYDHSGGGVRHHHFTTTNNIIDSYQGPVTTGDAFPAIGFATQVFHGQNVPFAFMSVHGAADGNHLFTSPGLQSVQVGASNLDVLVVYAPPGGIGVDGGPGVWVDAFNVDTGAFSDSDFIQVLTPPTPPTTVDSGKTSYANMEGEVSTLNAENLRAYGNVDGAPFLEWKKIVPVESMQDTEDVQLVAGETGEIWFAFYQTTSASVSVPNLHGRIDATLGRWIKDDYCGTPWPHGPIGPGGPGFGIRIPDAVLKGLPAASKTKLAGLAKEYPAAAKSAYAAMVKVQGMIGQVGSILSQAKGKQVG